MGVTPRWTPLKPHHEQIRMRNSRARFQTVPAGRRSGKTERKKRKLCARAWEGVSGVWPARFFAGAPTRDQAKRIWWSDLKAMVPEHLRLRKPSESELIIFTHMSEIHVVGLDKPERIEGVPWDGGVLDEYGNMKPEVWTQHVRPALSTPGRPPGWCDFIGVPEGRNHYYDLDRAARAYATEHGGDGEWDAFHWISADILDPAEIEAAKRDLDELTFQQEYEASFVNFVGRAYYAFEEYRNCARLEYDPKRPIAFCFDFNVDPGTASVAQEMQLPNGEVGTGFVGEVYIPRNSNTPAVCRKLAEDFGEHQSRITCYGDASGGARGSAKVKGSDWDLVQVELAKHFGPERLDFNVPKANPSERSRVNAVNSRCHSSAGVTRLVVDPSKCPMLVKDFEGVRLLEGGAGEIDKKHDRNLTHLTDGVGYYVAREFPIVETVVETQSFRWV